LRIWRICTRAERLGDGTTGKDSSGEVAMKRDLLETIDKRG
jgi:hypothetical protein